MKNVFVKPKRAIAILAIIMFSLLLLTIVTYYEFNRVIEDELIDTMYARTGESAGHINTWLTGQLGEVRETVNSPIIDRVLIINPQLDLTRNDDSIKLIDELNMARWRYVDKVYPNQYAALHIINYLNPDEWGNPENTSKLTARYYNVKDGICRTDLWAKAAAIEACERYEKTKQPYDAIFKPAYSQAYGRNMVLMLAWRWDNQGKALVGAAASLTLETIQQIAQEANFGKKGYEILLAQDGTFVTHPNSAWAMKETTFSVDDKNIRKLGELVASGNSGILRFVDNREKKIAFYHPIPIAGWTLVSVVDESELFLPASKLMIFLLAIMAIIFVFTLMAVYMVSLIVNLKRSNAAREELKVRNIELNATKERLKIQCIELEDAQKHLLSLDKMKDEFLTNVSHELKTPLHGVIGLAECTRDALLKQTAVESEHNLNLIIKSGARLASLVDEIADFATLKNHQVRLNKTAVNLHDLVQMVITLEKFAIIDQKVELENQIPPYIPLVEADSERLMQVFHNLIRNAITYTDKGQVSIIAHIENENVVISVRDTGIGITPSRLKSIFMPFEQDDSANKKICGGLGLGLSISKSLLELHNSELSVASEIGKGSCFSFTLPRWQGKDQDVSIGTFDTALLSRLIKTSAAIPSPELNFPDKLGEEENGAKKILVVDDEEVNLVVAKNCFYGMNFRVVCVRSGEEALKEVLNNDYNLVLVDMMMPGLNGIEVCREIRKTYSENTLPIIMSTVRNRPEDIEASFLAKANDYIAKPFHKKELLARVQAQMRSQEAYETERRAYRAEIAALQAQIQPHFLYNTLNTIITFCRTNPTKAAELLEELSDYLQNKFRFNSMNLIPLEQELDLIRSYLAIEKVRFGKRLNIVFDIDADLKLLIPPLILQPLVENAVKHGVYPKREGGTIQITIKETAEAANIIVADDGVGILPDKVECLLKDKNVAEAGIGLSNINKRLQRHYGYRLDIQSSLGKGTVITVKIPHKRGDYFD